MREAIRDKALVEGMTREAVGMAWGFPDRIVMDKPARTEEWYWNNSTRKATFQDERLVRQEGAKPAPRDR